MNRSKFDEFKSYILNANRLNRSVIEIFQTLNNLKEDVKSETIHLRPKLSPYHYEATLEGLIHDLKKLGYPEELDYTKIEPWLKEFDTTKEELLLWHIENPNVTHWESNESPNNMLFEILYTELELMANIEYPHQEKYKHLNDMTYSELQVIQYNFEIFFKSLIVKDLFNFITKQGSSTTKTNAKQNPYPRIFTCYNAFLLFEGLQDTVRQRSQLADCSFIYRRMQKDGLIHNGIKDREYRKWLDENYYIVIDKTKLLEYCTTSLKEQTYSVLKDKFKPY